MGLFKKKGRIIDLTENYNLPTEKRKSEADSEIIDMSKQSNSQGSGNFFGGFFGGGVSTPSSDSSTQVFGETVNPDERRRKLAKRLTDMTEKMEDLSNQIYHLQQRIEVLERKLH